MRQCADDGVTAVLLRPDAHISWCGSGKPDFNILKQAIAKSWSGSILSNISDGDVSSTPFIDDKMA